MHARILYSMEDFSSFAPVRLNHKPEKATTVALIFSRKLEKMDTVRVVFGIPNNMSVLDDLLGSNEASLDSLTDFKNTMIFDIKLIRELRQEGIENIDQLMDKVPQFCESLRFKRLIWDELHSDVVRRRKKNATIRLTSTVADAGGPLEHKDYLKVD